MRSTREGLHIRFDEGFAETLPYREASFDVAVSVFGMMFSPFPETVASKWHAFWGRADSCFSQLDPIWFWRKNGFGCRPIPSSAPSGHDISFPLGRRSNGSRQVEAWLRCYRNQRRGHHVGAKEKRRRLRRILHAECRSNPTLRSAASTHPNQAALLLDLEQLWIDNNLATDRENLTLISNEYLEALAIRR
jgi:hypothetical protein